MSAAPDSPAVCVTLRDLERGLDPAVLEQAFGADSLGIIVVRGLPAAFPALRHKVLTSISALARLPEHELAKLECKDAMWLAGWSRGKEILSTSRMPDYNKGSYYVNCAFHRDPHLEGPEQRLVEAFDCAAYTHPNVWPGAHLAGLADFEADVKRLCNLIIDVAATVASNCDRFIGRHNAAYDKGFLRRVVAQSTCTKARLLHYYPQTGARPAGASDDWCGEHYDHSCLTGLTSALFVDEAGAGPLDGSPDEAAGLYIKNRRGETVKVSIPADCLAFQSGTAIQEISGGSLRAVSHFVRGTAMPGIARNTLAVFCQPDLDEMVNATENFAQFADRIIQQNH